MNKPIIKIYAASLCAVQKTENLIESTGGMFYWEHSPLLVIAESIESASLEVKEVAFNTWKQDEGWVGHSATIKPVTSEFTNQLFGMIQQGTITVKADSAETQRIFRFDENTATDFDNVVSSDTH